MGFLSVYLWVMLGILNIIFASGSATGAPLGGILADSIGWRWLGSGPIKYDKTLKNIYRAFLLQVPFTLLAILAVSSSLTLAPTHVSVSGLRSKLKRVDFLGAALLVLAVFALLLALDRGGNVAWSDQTTVGCSVAAGVLFGAFAYVEFRTEARPSDAPSTAHASPQYRPEPFAPRRILLSRSLLPAYVANLTGFAASMCTIFHGALYFQAVARRSAAQAGARLLPAVLGGVVGSLCAGVLMQRTGRYYWLTVGAFGAEVAGTGGVFCVTRWAAGSGGGGEGGGFGKGVAVGMGLGGLLI